MSEIKTNIRLNLHKSPSDKRDHKIRVSTVSFLKSKIVDLSNFCTSVKNQGYVGSCTSFATIGLMEYIYKKATGAITEDIYSERFTYYATRVDQLGWNAADDSGAYLRNSVASVVKQGAAAEDLFPYYSNNNIDVSEKPSAAVYAAAENNQVVEYARVDADGLDKSVVLQQCLQLLDKGFPFVGGFICYDSLWNQSVFDTGVLAPPGGTMIGGHAVLFVGYDTNTNLLKFKNSWGEDWGDHGYGYLPFDYLIKDDLWDLWTILKQENFSNSDFLSIDTAPSTDEDKKENGGSSVDIRKCWGKIIKDIQDLTTKSEIDVKVQQTLGKLSLNVAELRADLDSHKIAMTTQLKSIQNDIINMYDMLN